MQQNWAVATCQHTSHIHMAYGTHPHERADAVIPFLMRVVAWPSAVDSSSSTTRTRPPREAIKTATCLLSSDSDTSAT